MSQAVVSAKAATKGYSTPIKVKISTVTDIDFGVWGYYDGYGIIDLQDYACQTGSDPEFCETFVPLEPDTTYYVLALAYAGDPGDEPYHIELEWVP